MARARGEGACRGRVQRARGEGLPAPHAPKCKFQRRLCQQRRLGGGWQVESAVSEGDTPELVIAPCVLGSTLVCAHTRPSLCTKAPKAVTPGLCEEENEPGLAEPGGYLGMGWEVCPRRPRASPRKCSPERCTIAARSVGVCEFSSEFRQEAANTELPQGLAGNLDG